MSAVTGRKVDSKVAMTGEVTLRGKVLPIGGLKEKLLAANVAGIKKVLVPSQNEKDAMSCQKEIVKRIRENGADYVIGLKENQPSLRNETEEYFTSALETPQFYPHVSKIVKHDQGHGRIETREYYLCTDPDYLKLHTEWKDLNSVGMMKSRIIQNEAETEETHYYISSLTDVNTFSDAARSHWGVENSLHWCLDVTFREDSSRMRKDHSAENFAVVRHIVLNTLKNMPDKMSVARRRRHCAYDDAYLASVLRSIHA